MLLDKLLANLAVEVEPFALCQVSTGWRLCLPGPPEVMFHFVLEGEGTVRGPDGSTQPLMPYWLAVVPTGAKHDLESGADVQHERRIEAPPAGKPVYQIIAGSAEAQELVVACGLVRVRYGASLGLFDHLREVLTIDFSDSPQVLAAFKGILAEQSRPALGSQVMSASLMSQCLVELLRHLGDGGDVRLPWLAAVEDPRLARALDRILETRAPITL